MTEAPKSIAIVQPFYIPWKGYFDIIRQVDEFVLFDDIQYAKRSWINRNKIKTPNGLSWLTIPVSTKGKYDQRICDTKISSEWAESHIKSIQHAYGAAPYYKQYEDVVFELIQKAAKSDLIARVNERLIKGICKLLGIETKISLASDLNVDGAKTQRLLNICKVLGAKRYVSGPVAKDYFEDELFERSGIAVQWMSYDGYPIYPQLYGDFEHGVTVLDVIFNTGPAANKYIQQTSVIIGEKAAV